MQDVQEHKQIQLQQELAELLEGGSWQEGPQRAELCLGGRQVKGRAAKPAGLNVNLSVHVQK